MLLTLLAVGAIGAQGVSAKSILTIGWGVGEGEEEGSTAPFGIAPMSLGMSISQSADYHLTFAFTYQGHAVRCEGEEQAPFAKHPGVLALNDEPVDTFKIGQPNAASRCLGPGFRAETPQFVEPGGWDLSAYTTGRAQLTLKGGKLQMELEILPTGQPAIACNFEHAPPKGAVGESTKVEPAVGYLTFTFPASGLTNLKLNKATSPRGCPKSLQVRFELTPRGPVLGERLLRGWVRPAVPALSLEKLQEIAGSGAGFTKSKLSAKVGQTVNYKIFVANEGDVKLRLGPLTDGHCEAMTGGLSENPLLPREVTYWEGAPPTFSIYTCKHTLTTQDLQAGSYSNSATITGTPPRGLGKLVMNSSNTVVVEVAR